MWGIRSTSTPSQVTIDILDIRKARYFFNKMNEDQVLVEKEELLRRRYPDSSYTEVVISEEKPMKLKYRFNAEILSISFQYGSWNRHGVPQH